MAWSYTESGNNTASSSWAITRPTASAGDLIIFCVAWDDSTNVTALTPPSGPNGETAVTIINVTGDSGTAVRGKIVYYIATGSWSSGSLTFSPSASEQWTAVAIKVPAGEFDPSTPISTQTNTTSSTGTTSPSLPSLTAGSSDGGGTLVGFMASDTNDPDGSISGWTERASTDRGAVGLGLWTRDSTVTNSESISAATGATLPASNAYVGFIFIVRINTAPTVALDSPADASSDSDTTPTLAFTGTDSESDDVTYEVQVSASSSFDSVGTADSYSETNRDANIQMQSGATIGVGQSFTGDGKLLSSVQFYLSKSSSPTGNAVAKIYAHSGTFGSGGLPTGSALATSDNFDVSSLTGSLTLTTFSFSGSNQVQLNNGTNYVVTVEYLGSSTSPNFVNVGYDSSSPSHAGSFSYYAVGVGAWSAPFAFDTCFYVYTYSPVLLDKYSKVDITNVQRKSSQENNVASSLAITFDNTTISGNFIAVKVSAYKTGGADPGITVSDGGTNTFTKLGADAVTSIGHGYAYIFYAYNITGKSSHQITISANATAYISAEIEEWSGILASGSPVDQNNTATGSSTAGSTGSVTTTTDNQLLLAVLTEDTAVSSTSGNGFTETLDLVTGQDLHSAYKIGDIQTTSGSFTLASSSVWAGKIGTFKSAISAGFVDVTDGTDIDPYDSGDQVSYTIQAGDALSAGTYYWRVRAKDPAGSGGWGAWSSTRSFTITDLTETLTDDFDDGTIDSSKYTNWGGGNVTESGGTLNINSGTTNGSYYGLDSLHLYNLTGSYMGIQVVTAGTQASVYGLYPVQLSVDSNNSIYWYINNGNAQCWKAVGGTYTQVGSNLTHVDGYCYRLRESSGTIYYDYSTDGGNNWTNQTSTTVSFAKTALLLTIFTELTGNTTARTPTLDNLNLAAASGSTTILTDDITISLTEDAATISQNHVVADTDIASSLSIDSTTISQNHVISTNDIAISLTEDSVTVDHNHILTAQDIAVSLSLDTTTITQNHIFSPDDIAFSLTSDNDTISQNHVIAGQDVAISLSMDNTTVSQNHVIATNDVAISLTTDNGTVAETNFILATQDVAVGLTLDATTITQNHVLAPSDVAIGLSEDNATISQNHVVATQDTAISLTTDNTTVDETVNTVDIYPADVLNSLTVDATTINQNHVLSPDDIAFSLSSDNDTISQDHAITAQDVDISLNIDTTTISQNHILAAQDVTTTTSTDNTTIIENYTAVTQDVAISTTTDNTTITQNHIFSPDDIAFSLTQDGGTISQNHVIASTDIAVSLTTDNTTISQNHIIATQDSAISTTADNATITQDHVITPQDILTSLSVDATTISQIHSLTVQGIAISLTEDNTTIDLDGQLLADDVTLSTALDNATIAQNHVFTPDDITFSLTSDSDTISQNHVVVSEDIALSLTVDSDILAQIHSFAPNDVSLATRIDSTLAYDGTPQEARKYYIDSNGDIYWVISQSIGLVEKV